MGVYESHVIIMTDGKKLDINKEMFEIIAEILSKQSKPDSFVIKGNIIFTKYITAIREKGTWRD